MKLVKTKIKSGFKQKRNEIRNRNRNHNKYYTSKLIKTNSKSKCIRKTKKMVQRGGM